MTPATAVEQGTSGDEVLFSAFRTRQVTNRRWVLVVVVPLFGALAAWASMRGQPDAVRIVTANGIRVVNPGMTPQEVLHVLGRPIGREQRADGMECFQHGMFSLTEPSTTVYLLCYESGKLRDVTTRRYALWQMDPDGTITPAGVPWGDAPGAGQGGVAPKP